MSRLTAKALCAACCCLLAVVSVARAGGVGSPLAWAPADADAVIAIRDSARVRRTALGAAGERAFLGMLAGATQTHDAWGAFAATLGWSESEAYDALLGERFVVIVRGIWSEDTPTEWLIVSDIAPGVDERIRERIASPPRDVLFGMPVFSLEQDRFSLLRHRDGDRARIIIAPTASMGLLKGVARNMRKPGADALADLPEAKRIAALGEGDALAVLRFPEGVGGWWGGVARFDEGAATAETVTTLPAPMEPPAKWSLAAWSAIADEAGLLLVERIMHEDKARPQGLEGVFRELSKAINPLLERAGASRAALLIRAREGGGLEGAGALECAAGRTAAPEVDDLMRRIVAWLGVVVADPAPGHDFAGILPESARRVRIGGAERISPALGAGPFEISWRFAPEQPRAEAGWWVGATADPTRALLERAIEGGAGLDGGHAEARPWLSFGVARPAALIDAVEATGVALPVAVRGFGGFESVQWWSWMDGPDEMLGRFRVSAAPEPGG